MTAADPILDGSHARNVLAQRELDPTDRITLLRIARLLDAVLWGEYTLTGPDHDFGRSTRNRLRKNRQREARSA